MPFTVVVADFQQLQPIGIGGECERLCKKMHTIELKTVYRSTDEQHLLFLNRIREKQPEKSLLKEYFEGRHWRHQSLESCVSFGMGLAKKSGQPFTR